MSVMQTRAKAAILRVGDGFAVGGNGRVGWFRVTSFGRALLYATPAEADTYTKPIRILIVPHDDPTTVGDTISWDGLSLVVKKAVKIRLRGETVARHLLVA